MKTLFDITNRNAYEYNIQVAPKLREISSPFMDLYGIKGICYFRYFEDGRMLRLATIEEWTQQFFQHQLYNSPEGDCTDLARAVQNQEHLVIQTGQPNGEMSEVLFDLGIWNSCGIYRSFGDSVEGFFLAGTAEDERVINFFLNKREIVNHFLHFMKDRMEHEIHDKKGYITSNLNLSAIMTQSESVAENDLALEKQLLGATPIRNYYLAASNQEIALSPREYQVIQSLSDGLTCKEIAREQNLSPRTVETYLLKAKDKMHCSTKSELIQLFKDSGLKEKF